MKLNKWIGITAGMTLIFFGLSFISWNLSRRAGEHFPAGLAVAYASSVSEGVSVNTSRTIEATNIDEIDLSTVAVDVAIAPSQDKTIDLHIEGNFPSSVTTHLLDTTVNGSRLVIPLDQQEKSAEHKFWFHLGDNGKRLLTVAIPKDIHRLIIKTVSGDIKITQADLDNLEAHTVSGDLKLDTAHVQNVVWRSTSGDWVSHGFVNNMKGHSVSGDFAITTDAASPQIKVETTSGDVKLLLSQKPNLKIDFHSVSGDGSVETAGVHQKASSEFSLGLGQGNGLVSVSSVSGDLSVKQME